MTKPEGRVEWTALVVGLLFLAAAAYNLFGPDRDYGDGLACAVLAALLVGLFFLLRSQHQRDGAFGEWFAKNVQGIERGGARYGDALITPATVLVRYHAALSFLIVSFKISSRLYIVDQESTGGAAAVFTVTSLLLGWWGIPWGPVYTVQALATNIRGGVKQTVGDLLRLKPTPR